LRSGAFLVMAKAGERAVAVRQILDQNGADLVHSLTQNTPS